MAGKRQAPAKLLDRGKATQWKPGQSGNPAGPKPGMRDLRELLEAAMLETRKGRDRPRLAEFVENLANRLAICEPHALDKMLARFWPVPLDVNLHADVTLSDADREDFAAGIRRDLAERATHVNGTGGAGPVAGEPHLNGSGEVP